MIIEQEKIPLTSSPDKKQDLKKSIEGDLSFLTLEMLLLPIMLMLLLQIKQSFNQHHLYDLLLLNLIQMVFSSSPLSLSVRVCQLNQNVKFPIADNGFWHPSRPFCWSLEGRRFEQRYLLLTCGLCYWKLYTSFLSDNDFANKFRTTIRSVSDKYADDACVNPASKWKMVKYASISVTFTKEICIFGQKQSARKM